MTLFMEVLEITHSMVVLEQIQLLGIVGLILSLLELVVAVQLLLMQIHLQNLLMEQI